MSARICPPMPPPSDAFSAPSAHTHSPDLPLSGVPETEHLLSASEEASEDAASQQDKDVDGLKQLIATMDRQRQEFADVARNLRPETAVIGMAGLVASQASAMMMYAAVVLIHQHQRDRAAQAEEADMRWATVRRERLLRMGARQGIRLKKVEERRSEFGGCSPRRLRNLPRKLPTTTTSSKPRSKLQRPDRGMARRRCLKRAARCTRATMTESGKRRRFA